MDETAPSPRPEAAPRAWDQLSSGQQKVARDIFGMLRSMAAEPSGQSVRPEPRYLPRIDRQRTNRVLLIDGERGSGKSVLLLTVLDAYIKRHPAQEQRQLAQELEAEVAKQVDDRVVPVGLLDLQPLPQSTDLLLHLMSRFELLVDSLEPKSAADEGKFEPWNDAASARRSPLRQKWEDFTRIAASWREDFRVRMPRLDSGSYAIEAREGEFERGRLMEVFREAFDALVEAYQKQPGWPGGRQPLFLLAIDDADMNPDLCVPLLDLMRKLWHPRLAFLLTGHSKQFVHQITKKLVETRRSLDEEEQQFIKALAYDMYGKDVPRTHRFDLNELTPEERAGIVPEVQAIFERFKISIKVPSPCPGTRAPSGRGSHTEQGGHPSSKEKSGVSQRPANPPEGNSPHKDVQYDTEPTLLDYLAANQHVAALMPGRIRQIYDFRAALKRIAGSLSESETQFEAIRMAHELWKYLCEENSERGEVLRAAQINTLAQQIVIDASRLQTRIELDQAVLQQDKYWLICAYPVDFELKLIQKKRQVGIFLGNISAEESLVLSKTLTGAWLLLLDLAADSGRGVFTARSNLMLEAGANSFMSCSWEPPEKDSLRENERIIVPWPMPEWPAPLDYWLVGLHWKKALLEGSAFRERDIALLARQFLHLICCIAHQRAAPSDEWLEKPPSWKELAFEVAKLGRVKRSSLRGESIARWAVERAGLLFAPECGLPDDDAREFLEALQESVGKDWTQHVIALESARLINVSREGAAREQGHKLLNSLDEEFLSHPFLKWVGAARTTSGSGQVESFAGDLDQFERRKPSGSPSRRESLRSYMTDIRKELLRKPPALVLTTARDVMLAFRDIRQSTSEMLMAMWRKTVRVVNPQLENWFDIRNGEIMIKDSALAMAKKTRARLLEVEEQAVTHVVQVDPVRSIRISHLKDPNRYHDDNPLPAPLDAIFRLIFDYALDQKEHQGGRSSFVSAWPAISVVIGTNRQMSLNSWPILLPQTLIEMERIHESWPRSFSSIGAMLEVDDSSALGQLGDAIAMAYLSDWDSWIARSRGGYSLSFEHDADTISRILEGLVKNVEKMEDADLYVRLLATPEAATSHDVAGILLNTVGERSEKLRELRRRMAHQHYFGAKGPDRDVEALLRDIDAMFPDHPWVERVERRRAGE